MSEISIKSVCCTCLSSDRKLRQLCRILDGINLLYMLLTLDPEAYKDGFYKDTTSLLVCWECSSIMHRIKLFQTQACVAQKQLTAIVDRQNGIKCKSLSKLSSTTFNTHFEFKMNEITPENFIDCGLIKEIKSESDSDDVPLSTFYYENNECCDDPGYSNIDPDNDDMDSGNKNIDFDNKNMDSGNHNMDSGYKNTYSGNCDKTSGNDNMNTVNKNMDSGKDVDSGNAKIELSIDNIDFGNCNIDFGKGNIDFGNTSQTGKSNMEHKNQCLKSGKINSLLKNSSTLDNNEPDITTEVKNIVKEESNSKKKTKMKYSKYFLLTIMVEEEMLKSVEKRKIDLNMYAIFKCDSCFIEFNTENELLIHYQNLHEEKDNCSECDICHAYVEELDTHRQTHYHSYNCMLCTHISYTHTDIVTHIKRNHKEICSSKKKESKRKRNGMQFDAISKYPCPECDLSFQNKDLRWKHTQKAHREGYKCSECDKKFAFKNNLERHERVHKSPLPREECPTCHKSIRIDLIKIHSRIHTHRPQHRCVECDKTFVSRATYETHLKYARAHASVDVCRHSCPSCPKRYRSRGELRDHINYYHNGQAEHKCPICGKGLATKRCIRRHVRRTHEGIKENAKDKICQQCGRAFRDKKTLVEHLRVHSGARPLSCGECGRAFRQRAALTAHAARLHPAVGLHAHRG